MKKKIFSPPNRTKSKNKNIIIMEDVDRWVNTLLECKPLSENDVRALCEKVPSSTAPFFSFLFFFLFLLRILLCLFVFHILYLRSLKFIKSYPQINSDCLIYLFEMKSSTVCFQCFKMFFWFFF